MNLEKCVAGSISETRDAGRSWYQHFRDRLANKFRVHESALEKGLYLYQFNGRLIFVTVTHVDDLFYAYDSRCKTTKSLLDAIVKEFTMSRKQDDFVFCGRRVRVTPSACSSVKNLRPHPLIRWNCVEPSDLPKPC